MYLEAFTEWDLHMFVVRVWQRILTASVSLSDIAHNGVPISIMADLASATANTKPLAAANTSHSCIQIKSRISTFKDPPQQVGIIQIAQLPVSAVILSYKEN
jgi:hypothetical protein